MIRRDEHELPVPVEEGEDRALTDAAIHALGVLLPEETARRLNPDADRCPPGDVRADLGVVNEDPQECVRELFELRLADLVAELNVDAVRQDVDGVVWVDGREPKSLYTLRIMVKRVGCGRAQSGSDVPSVAGKPIIVGSE